MGRTHIASNANTRSIQNWHEHASSTASHSLAFLHMNSRGTLQSVSAQPHAAGTPKASVALATTQS